MDSLIPSQCLIQAWNCHSETQTCNFICKLYEKNIHSKERKINFNRILRAYKGRGRLEICFCSFLFIVLPFGSQYTIYNNHEKTVSRAYFADSDGKYRYNEVLISIDTSGTVIDKYWYFPFILFSGRYVCTLENVKKLACNLKKIFFRSGEIFK